MSSGREIVNLLALLALPDEVRIVELLGDLPPEQLRELRGAIARLDRLAFEVQVRRLVGGVAGQ